MKLLKDTKSFCPVCHDVIPARIYQRDDSVWMLKECEKHGESESLLERDVNFYNKTMNPRLVINKIDPTIMVPVTHRCNLKCKFCYVPNREREDLSIAQLKNVIFGLPPCQFGITGGEPTLREDLFEIIALLKSRSNTISIGLITNGIKLVDKEYVKKLRDAGVNLVTFSFNGFDDGVYEEINNKKLLKIKLKALNNLKSVGIPTQVSSTLIRGLNEKDIKKIMDYVLQEPHPFIAVRIRGAARVGSYDLIDPLCTSELLDIMAKAIGFSKESFLKDFKPDRCYHSPYQFTMKLFFLLKNGKRKLVHWNSGYYCKRDFFYMFEMGRIFFRVFIRGFLELLRDLGPSALKKSLRSYREARIRHGMSRRDSLLSLPNIRSINVSLWGWPDASNVDLNDIQGPAVYHMTHDGRILPFYEAAIRSEDL